MIKSFSNGKALIGSIVTGLSSGKSLSRVMHISFGHSVDFRRTRTAFARFAIPATGEVVGLRRLNVMDCIEHDHSFRDAGGVIAKLTAARVAAPDPEGRLLLRAHFISSMTCFK